MEKSVSETNSPEGLRWLGGVSALLWGQTPPATPSALYCPFPDDSLTDRASRGPGSCFPVQCGTLTISKLCCGIPSASASTSCKPSSPPLNTPPAPLPHTQQQPLTVASALTSSLHSFAIHRNFPHKSLILLFGVCFLENPNLPSHQDTFYVT